MVLAELNSRAQLRRKGGRGRLFPAVATAAVLMTVPALAALAAPINYQFVPGATVELGGYTEGIVGSFQYDPTTEKVSGTSLALTGAGPYSGSYTVPGWSTANEFYVGQVSGQYLLEFIFGSGLSGLTVSASNVIENWRDSGGNWVYVSDGSPNAVANDPISYVFSGASTVLGGTTYVISGSFVFNPITEKVTETDISLSGAGPYAGSYTAVGWSTPGEFYVSETSGPYMLEFLFGNNLPDFTVSLSNIIENWKDSSGNWTYVSDGAPNGGAVDPPGLIPEPSSLALVVAFIGIFGLAASRRRRTA